MKDLEKELEEELEKIRQDGLDIKEFEIVGDLMSHVHDEERQKQLLEIESKFRKNDKEFEDSLPTKLQNAQLARRTYGSSYTSQDVEKDIAKQREDLKKKAREEAMKIGLDYMKEEKEKEKEAEINNLQTKSQDQDHSNDNQKLLDEEYKREQIRARFAEMKRDLTRANDRNDNDNSR